MEFTKENLAAEICGIVEFDEDCRFSICDEIHFDKISVYVEGIVFGEEDLNGFCQFDNCEIYSIEVYHEDPSEDFVFNTDELIEMEELVKLWM